MLKTYFSGRFAKSYKRLTNQEQKQFQEKLLLFINDPTIPSLRTKKIKDSEGLFEFSINMDIRVIWKYREDSSVLLIDIGHHNILNKY